MQDYTKIKIPPISKITEETILFFEEMFRATLPDMSMVSSPDFRVIAFIAFDERKLMRLVDGAYTIEPAYIPNGTVESVEVAMQAIVPVLRSRVEAIKSGNDNIYLLSADPLTCLQMDYGALDPELEEWMRNKYISLAKYDPVIANSSFDDFRRELVKLLSESGSLVTVHSEGKVVMRMTRRMKRAIKRKKGRK